MSSFHQFQGLDINVVRVLRNWDACIAGYSLQGGEVLLPAVVQHGTGVSPQQGVVQTGMPSVNPCIQAELLSNQFIALLDRISGYSNVLYALQPPNTPTPNPAPQIPAPEQAPVQAPALQPANAPAPAPKQAKPVKIAAFAPAGAAAAAPGPVPAKLRVSVETEMPQLPGKKSAEAKNLEAYAPGPYSQGGLASLFFNVTHVLI